METVPQIKIINLSSESEAGLDRLCRRPKIDFPTIFRTIEPIIDHVKENGDEAIRFYNKKFDHVAVTELTVNPKSARVNLPANVKKAFKIAYENIYKFHEAQQPSDLSLETMPGVSCMRLSRPIERVGLYIPGGSAILPSTVLMLGIPAKLAGCRQIVIATPPRPDNSLPDEILYAAGMVGADIILKAGGAQAIAAMAYGTESVPKVDKILGPGNQYVTAAKMLLQNSEAGISIDMPAGPSEVLVVADDRANPVYVAADLLSQAEHGPDSQVVAVVLPGFDTASLLNEISSQLEDLPRSEIALKALSHSYIIKAGTPEDALDFSNRYAPEHLILNMRGADRWLEHVMNAGSVFLGSWSPESVGDYASGTNHTLPTYGYARMYSGISIDSFMRRFTAQQLTKEGLRNLGPTVMTLAETEQLEAHKRAVRFRLNDIKNQI